MPGAPGPSPLITKSSSPLALKLVLVLGLLLAGLAVVAFNQTDDDPGDVETVDHDTTPVDSTPPADNGQPEITVPADTVLVGTVLVGTVPDETAPAETVPAETVPAEIVTVPADVAVVDGAPDGSDSEPVPAGVIADIGDGWRLQVLEVNHDATDAVLERNQFNDPPPDGSRYTLVNVAVGYYGLDDPTGAFTTTIDAVGAGDPTADRECGVVVPDELEQYDELFTGGVVSGNLCFVTTPADTNGLQLAAAGAFGQPAVRLDASVTPQDLSEMPTLRGPQPNAAATPARAAPIPIGDTADVGAGWTVTVAGVARDITDDVLSTNQFNDPPPDGSRFVGVPVVYEYRGDDVANGFDLIAKAVGDSNRELRRDCGVVPNAIDPAVDIVGGDMVVGDVCFVVPVDDIDTIVLFASADFRSDPKYFTTQ